MRALVLAIAVVASQAPPVVANAEAGSNDGTPAPALPASSSPSPTPAPLPPAQVIAAPPAQVVAVPHAQVVAAPPAQVVAAPPARAAAQPPAVIAAPVADAGRETRPADGPIESRFNVRFDVDTVWYAKPSFDLFSTHDTSLFPGVSVGYAVIHAEPVSVIPELGFSANSESATNLFGGALSHTSLASKNAFAGVSLRWGLLSVLDVAGRLSGGVSFVHFEMQPGAPNTLQLEDDNRAPFMTLGGGFTVHTPSGALRTKSGALRSLIAGLSVESGYVLGGSVALTPAPTGDAGRIKTDYLSLGRLERSGPYIKTSLAVRF